MSTYSDEIKPYDSIDKLIFIWTLEQYSDRIDLDNIRRNKNYIRNLWPELSLILDQICLQKAIDKINNEL